VPPEALESVKVPIPKDPTPLTLTSHFSMMMMMMMMMMMITLRKALPLITATYSRDWVSHPPVLPSDFSVFFPMPMFFLICHKLALLKLSFKNCLSTLAEIEFKFLSVENSYHYIFRFHKGRMKNFGYEYGIAYRKRDKCMIIFLWTDRQHMQIDLSDLFTLFIMNSYRRYIQTMR